MKKNKIVIDNSVGSQAYFSIVQPNPAYSMFQVVVEHVNGSVLINHSIFDPLDRQSIVYATARELANCADLAFGVDGQPYLWHGNHWINARVWLETVATSMHGLLRTGQVNASAGSKGFYSAVLPAWNATGRQALDLTAYGRCDGIPLEDGVVGVDASGQLVSAPHSSKNGNLRFLPVKVEDVLASFAEDEIGVSGETLLKKFLNQVLTPDQLTTIQRWFGLHFVVNKIGNPEKLLYLYGDGGNGKGVLQNLLIELLTPDAVANVTLQDLKHSAAVELLSGKAAMIASEAKPSTNNEALKTIVSWESLTVNPKYRDPYKLNTQVLVTQSSNKEPRFDDESDAMQRRVIALHMTHRANESQRIPHLAEKIRDTEYADLVAFALRGAIELLQAKRFEVPASIQAWSAAVVRKVKPVDAFIEKLEFGQFEIAELELYAAYKKMSRMQQSPSRSLPEFRKELMGRLERSGHIVERRERAYHYIPQAYVNEHGEKVPLVPQLVGQPKMTIYLGMRISADAECFGAEPIGQDIPAVRRQIQMYQAA